MIIFLTNKANEKINYFIILRTFKLYASIKNGHKHFFETYCIKKRQNTVKIVLEFKFCIVINNYHLLMATSFFMKYAYSFIYKLGRKTGRNRIPSIRSLIHFESSFYIYK